MQIFTKHGVLIYENANNLGDEIQTLSAMQFIEPEIFVNRDNITNEKREVKLIGNAFWNERSMLEYYKVRFNPPDNVKMFPISMHLNKTIKLDWFRKNQPIGARDTYTMKFLQDNGIESYFSGCLTLTFPEYKGKREKRILLVGEVGEWNNVKFPYKVIKTSSVGKIKDQKNTEKRLEMARELLDLYKKSSLVITSKIHAIFPCIAMGTPVIAVRLDRNKERLLGYDFIPEYKPHNIQDIENYKIKRPEKIINNLQKLLRQWI